MCLHIIWMTPRKGCWSCDRRGLARWRERRIVHQGTSGNYRYSDIKLVIEFEINFHGKTMSNFFYWPALHIVEESLKFYILNAWTKEERSGGTVDWPPKQRFWVFWPPTSSCKHSLWSIFFSFVFFGRIEDTKMSYWN